MEDERTSRMQRGKLANGMNLKVNVEDDQAPWRKLLEMGREQLLTQLVEQRQDQCWLCGHAPITWVREVIFDLGDKEDDPIMKTALVVNASTYPGPVPGFCAFHIGKGPCLLAELVYNDSTVVTYGFRPTRWFVMLTDGSSVRGKAVEIDHNIASKPHTLDTHSFNSERISDINNDE